MEKMKKVSDTIMDHLCEDQKHDTRTISVFCGAYNCMLEIENGADTVTTVCDFVDGMLPHAKFRGISAEEAIDKFFYYILMDKRLFGF